VRPGGGRPSRGGMWVGRLLTALALAGLVAALSGCESTQEESAHLEAAAKREKAEHPTEVQKGLSIARVSTQVRVVSATVVHDSEGAAAAVTVVNDSSHALSAVPIEIAVRGASGQTVYENNTPGLEASLTELSRLPAHATLTWVDDQVSTTGGPASVSATVGEAPAASGPEPRIEVQGTHLAEASTGEVSGTVHNGSNAAQHQLVVYVVARRGGQVVAAGRAIVAELAAGASASFHAFLIGATAGAALEASAPASAAG
jgi:hypothetical protein